MKRKFTSLLMIALLTSCQPDESVIASSDSLVHESRLDSFEKIIFEAGVGRLYVTQGDKESLRIQASAEVLDMITATINDGTLRLGIKEKKYPFSEKVKFYVAMKTLSSITLNGNGELQSEGTLAIDSLEVDLNGSGSVSLDVKGKGLRVTISGSGDADIKGQVEEQVVHIAGAGTYHAQDLLSKDAVLTLNGSGNVLVNVTENLKVDIYGSGSVRFRGHPKLTQAIQGSGAITSLN